MTASLRTYPAISGGGGPELEDLETDGIGGAARG